MEHGGRRRAIVIVGATVLLCLAVAFASRPTELAPDGARDAALVHLLGDVGLYLLLVLLAAVLGVTIWALWPDRLPRGKLKPRPWWQQLLPYLGLLALAALLALVIRDPAALRRLRSSPLARLIENLRTQPPPAAAGTQASAAGPDWAAIAIVAGVVALAAGFVVWRWQLARRRRPPVQELALALEEALEASLGGLVAGTEQPLDAREAVIAAWTGFERVLARAGVPVRAGETPHEYLSRALEETSLTLDAAALSRFTDLFEWARYSTNPVTEAMREEAVATLTAVRDGLHHHAVPDLHVVPA